MEGHPLCAEAVALRKIFFPICLKNCLTFFDHGPYLAILDNFGPFFGPGTKSVKSDLKKIWDPHRKDKRQWLGVKNGPYAFKKKVDNSDFRNHVMLCYLMICYAIFFMIWHVM